MTSFRVFFHANLRHYEPFMTNPLIYAGVIATASGTSTLLLQSASPIVSPMFFSVAVSIVSAVIAGAVSYGVLQSSVKSMKENFTKLEDNVSHIYDLMRDQTAKIARIEGRLDTK